MTSKTLTMIIALSMASLRGGPADYPSLQAGQWVKVEGHLVKGVLKADKVEAIDPDELEVEGLIEAIGNGGQVQVAGFRVRLDSSTKIEDSGRRSRSLQDLKLGLRVKIKFSRRTEKSLQADLLRIYPGSRDRDIEVQGPVELTAEGFSLHSLDIRVSKKTRYSRVLVRNSDDHKAGAGRILRDDDEPDLPPRQWMGFYLGGKAGLSHLRRSNADLIEGGDDDRAQLEPRVQLEVLRPLGETVEFYSRFDYRPNIDLEGPDRPNNSFRVREAYVYLRRFLHPDLSLQVGRQRFRDDREWLYDDELDAVRVHYRRKRFKFELAAARSFFGAQTSRSDQFYLIGRAEVDLPGHRSLAGYWIKRNDLTGRDEDPVWFGLSSRGRLPLRLEYWLETSRMLGRRGSRRLKGYGFDLGLSYPVPALPVATTLSFSYAFGSGDNDLGDGVDGNFRQTRLNDNSARIEGLKRFRYYGLVLRPELFNIHIATAVLGLRPSHKWSVDLAYHHYRQAQASRRVGDHKLLIRPNGRDPRLGQEFDLIFAVRPRHDFEIGFSIGSFFPGPAFPRDAAQALLFQSEFRFFF